MRLHAVGAAVASQSVLAIVQWSGCHSGAPTSSVWRFPGKRRRSDLRWYTGLLEPERRFHRARRGRPAGKPICKGRKPCNGSSAQQEPICKKSASLFPNRPTTRRTSRQDRCNTLRIGRQPGTALAGTTLAPCCWSSEGSLKRTWIRCTGATRPAERCRATRRRSG